MRMRTIDINERNREEKKEGEKRKVFGNIKQALGSYEPTKIEKLFSLFSLNF